MSINWYVYSSFQLKLHAIIKEIPPGYTYDFEKD